MMVGDNILVMLFGALACCSCAQSIHSKTITIEEPDKNNSGFFSEIFVEQLPGRSRKLPWSITVRAGGFTSIKVGDSVVDAKLTHEQLANISELFEKTNFSELNNVYGYPAPDSSTVTIFINCKNTKKQIQLHYYHNITDMKARKEVRRLLDFLISIRDIIDQPNVFDSRKSDIGFVP